MICSLSKSYKDGFSKKNINHFNKKFEYRIIGMGESTLGAKEIYNFLKKKIKKNFKLIENLSFKDFGLEFKNYKNVKEFYKNYLELSLKYN